MYKRTVFLAFLTLKMTLLPVKAQFYTISADTAHLSHSSAQEEIPMMVEKTRKRQTTVFSPLPMD